MKHKESLVLLMASSILAMMVFPSRAWAQLLEWSFHGPIEGKFCVRINEPSEPRRADWDDNYLCSEEDLGIVWSYNGPIDGMRCVRIREPSEPDRDHWNDNFLCVPWTSNIELTWSFDGFLPDKECVQIGEPSDKDYWDDNYLCYEVFPYNVAQPPPGAPGRLLGWTDAEYPSFNTVVRSSANPCVEDVLRSFYEIDSRPRDSALFTFGTEVDGAGDIDRHHHAQGIGRIPGFDHENWGVVSKSGGEEADGTNRAGLIFFRFPGLDSDGGPWAEAVPTGVGDFDTGHAEVFLHPAGTDAGFSTHVGGVQVLGKMLVAGWDREGAPADGTTPFAVDFYDLSDPWDIESESRLLNRFTSADIEGVHYVAATRLSDGVYLLMTARDGRRRYEGPRRFRFFLSDSTEITPETSWSFINSVVIAKEGLLGYQSANMVTECGTEEIYLLGMRPDRIRRNFIDLWRLEWTEEGTIRPVLVDVKEVWNTLDGCSFDAGGGIHVTPDHKLVVYCVEKIQDFGGRLMPTLDLEEFRDR